MARGLGFFILFTAGIAFAESPRGTGKPPLTPEEISAAYGARVPHHRPRQLGRCFSPEYRAPYWTRRFPVTRQPEDTLNCDVRVLGRRGALSLALNAIAGMNRVTDIEGPFPTQLSMVGFHEGHRYDDFNAATNNHAGLSLAGLVVRGLPTAAIQTLDPSAGPRLWIHLIPVALVLPLLFPIKRAPSDQHAASSAPETLT